MDQLPANVALYIRQEIERRTQYKVEMETTVRPPTFDLVKCNRYEASMSRLKDNISRITRDVLPIVKQYMPDIAISENDELTIANILAKLPPAEELVVKRLYHANDGSGKV